MKLFEKSKTDEMRRLRAAGFSIAHAERLAQGRRKSGPLLAVAGCLGLFLVGGIAALSLKVQAPVQPPLQTAAQNAEPVAATLASTEDAVTVEAAAILDGAPEQAGVTTQEETSGDDWAAVRTVLEQTPQPEEETSVEEPVIAALAEPEELATAQSDCVDELIRYVEPVIIQFDLGSTEITGRNAQLLAQISDRVVACPQAHVIVGGHADSTGDDVINMKISWERADNTRERMLLVGVDPLSVEAVGFGARAPVSEGSAGEDEADRRVEFRVLRKREGAS